MLLTILLKNLDLISEAKQPRGTRVTKVVTTAPADAVADTNENEPEQVRTRVETIHRLDQLFFVTELQQNRIRSQWSKTDFLTQEEKVL